VAQVHHFTYGAFNPLAAYLLAFLGSFLGLLSTGRAREARTNSRRNRWLLIAAFAIGGGGIWLMHFTAMLGFDVPASPVRYRPLLTLIGLGMSVVTVGIGLMIVGHGRRSTVKTGAAGLITGLGMLAVQYTGMQSLHLAGHIYYQPVLLVASGVIAIAAATTGLWFAVSVRGWGQITGASAILGLGMCGMHYLGMAAIEVRLSPVVQNSVGGIRPLVMIVPITLITAATILAVALSALQAMTEEEFTDGAAGLPRRGVHAENPWSLKQASLAAARRTPGTRPSPRSVQPRPVLSEEGVELEPAVRS
jgi:NO-binding membrane sensor protein with MHYT domain